MDSYFYTFAAGLCCFITTGVIVTFVVAVAKAIKAAGEDAAKTIWK